MKNVDRWFILSGLHASDRRPRGRRLALVGMLTFLANYFLNEFSQPSVSAREKV